MPNPKKRLTRTGTRPVLSPETRKAILKWDRSRVKGGLIDDIKRQMTEHGLRNRTLNARKWLVRKIREIETIPARPQFINYNRKRIITSRKPAPGLLHLFIYDPKWKAILPFYDKFPLMIPLEYYKDGWLGLNCHYLPWQLRLQLLDRMHGFLNNKMYDETTRIMINYEIVKQTSKLNIARPCIKRYLYGHVRSPFVRIEADEFDIAAMLPVYDFMKRSAQYVWRDSVSQI